MKKVLIVSPHFPPINAPDMQRVRMSLPYYRASGWEPVVLAVDERWQDGLCEPELSAGLPADVRVVKTRAFSRGWTRWVGIGTLGLRSWPFLLWRGTRLLRQEKFDLVFFSNTQFITFTIGPLWKRWLGVPYVIDVQDPWRTDYYERKGSRRPPGGWKYQFARFQAWAFEGWVFKGCAALMSVSPRYIEDLRARYPAGASKPAEVLRFGASRADLDQALRLPPPSYAFPREGGEVHLLYTGASGPVMPHALTVLFVALRIYRERVPERARRLHFHFVGTSYEPSARARPSVLPIAEQCGVSEHVSEVPYRIGFLEAIRLQRESDVLLLLGSSDLAYSPSKAYMYFLTGRPILGLVFRDSVMEHLLDELSCAVMVRFRELEAKDAAYVDLQNFFDRVLDGFHAEAMPVRNEAYFTANYLAEELTRRQCALFERALAPNPPP